MAALIAQQGEAAYGFLPDFQEYAALYPHMPEADGNPDSPRMVAGMLVSSNRKELPRWMAGAKPIKGLARFELGPVEKHGGYDLFTRVRLFVQEGEGKEIEFPVFRNLIRIGNTYKIWVLLEN